jgi:plasmid stabilization system protein ParE
VKPIALLRAVQGDLRRAARFYENETPGLGRDFVAEVGHAFSLLEQNPEIGVQLRRGARRLLVRRFPYLIIYRNDSDRVLVLAIGHQRRHPDFWLGRS